MGLLFRAGGFILTTKVDCQIWCIVTRGNETCWARKGALGGRCANIGVRCIKLCESSYSFLEGHGDDERTRALYIADRAHELMGEQYSKLGADGWVSGSSSGKVSGATPLLSKATS